MNRRSMGTGNLEPFAWARAAHGIATALAFVFAATGVLYWFIGIDATLDFGGRMYAYVFPVVDGKLASPLLDWDRVMFKAHRLATYGHVIFCPIALAIGPLQFWRRIRERNLKVHRALGRVYLASQFIGIPCGMYLSRFEYGGFTAMYGFFGMGLTTLTCSVLAFAAIRRRDFAAHRAWMIRSYFVMWCSAVLFRLAIAFLMPRVVPLPSGFRDAYLAFIFLSWAAGLLAADVYLHLTRPLESQLREPVAAPAE